MLSQYIGFSYSVPFKTARRQITPPNKAGASAIADRTIKAVRTCINAVSGAAVAACAISLEKIMGRTNHMAANRKIWTTDKRLIKERSSSVEGGGVEAYKKPITP